jgi:hypothetical protein
MRCPKTGRSQLLSDGIRGVDGAVIKLPSGNPEVHLYLVQSVAPATHAEHD